MDVYDGLSTTQCKSILVVTLTSMMREEVPDVTKLRHIVFGTARRKLDYDNIPPMTTPEAYAAANVLPLTSSEIQTLAGTSPIRFEPAPNQRR